MNLLRNLLLRHGERHLQKYRKQANSIGSNFREEYLSYVPIIESCYTRAAYWHGTGLYHHQHPGDTRYRTDTKQITNVLDSILSRGIHGHKDLWVADDDRLSKTVSLAPSRMHARVYAHIHLREGVWLPYVFGGTRFWMGFFVFFGLWDVLSQVGKGTWEWTFLKQSTLSRKYLNHARTWANAIRDTGDYKILPVWRAYDLRSDIEGNHPILFGIAKDPGLESKLIPFLKRVEVRVAGDVPLESLTHLEVPLAHVNSVKQILAEKKVSLPVIPLEFGELYCSQFPVAQLAHV